MQRTLDDRNRRCDLADAADTVITQSTEEPSPLHVAVTTRAERLLSSGHWLLSAAPSMPQGRQEWNEQRAAWLKPGFLFAAATIPSVVVHAAIGLESPQECAGPLAEVLEGGPIFYRPGPSGVIGSYTALISPVAAAAIEGTPHVEVHPRRALLRVPAPEKDEPDGLAPWWVVPLDGPGVLCPAGRLIVLVGLGHEAITRPGGGRGA